MQVDVVVIGSGGSGMSAAMTAASLGVEVIVLERTDLLGGTTTYSGGALWIPNNRLMAEAGMKDSRDEALIYLRKLTGGFVPERMLETFVDSCNQMIEYFEENAGFEMSCRYAHADYQASFPGAKPGGRCIENDHITYANELGEYAGAVRSSYAALSSPTLANLLTSPEMAAMNQSGVPLDPAIVTKRAEQGALMRGRGLVANFLKVGMKHGLTALLSTEAVKLVRDGDRIVGVDVEHDGMREHIATRMGVVLATGGFEWNRSLVQGYLGVPDLSPASPPTGLGLGLGLALEVGAAVGNMTNAWWDVVHHEPGQIYEGKPYFQTSTLWRGRAGTVMVNNQGRRFVNESMNYADMAVIMKSFDPLTYEFPNIPCHTIFDSHMRNSFVIGTLDPSDPDPDWLMKGDTLAELAEITGINAAGLEKQMEVFNRNAEKGVDPEFHRGDDPYDRYRGDPNSKHPNLRPLDGPFYAIPQMLGCLGTKGGPLTNENAQVFDRRMKPLDGLYAVGNVMSNVFGFSYPGPGATLGSGLTFGYRAGHHLVKNTKG